jgi:hypothetical protein
MIATRAAAVAAVAATPPNKRITCRSLNYERRAECLPGREIHRASSANAVEVRRPVGKGRTPVRQISRRCTVPGPVLGRCTERRASVGRFPEGRREASTSPSPFNRGRLPNIVAQDLVIPPRSAAVLAPRSCSPHFMPISSTRSSRSTNLRSPLRQSLSPATPRHPRPPAQHATSQPAALHSGPIVARHSRCRLSGRYANALLCD